MSSIIARFINFFFVPIYTRVLNPGNYGLASELLAYIALLQVILTFGLETGFFRFANKEKENAESLFSTASTWLLVTSAFFCLLIFAFSGSLSDAMGHSANYLLIVALILSIDCFTAIYFAKLRFDNRPWLFASLKSIKILSEVGFNLMLFFWLPSWFEKHPDSFLLNIIPPRPDYGYILLAILLSAIVSLILFVPQLLKTPLKFSPSLWKKLMIYSLPLMIAGLPGIANDYVDRILFRYFSPDTSPWIDQLGIYSAVMKLAVFITLFVQMFRYASEPFFFASSHKESMKQTYADVMKYFIILGLLLFLGIVFYADLFALILGKNYRSGMDVLPLVLLANILLGVSFNLSMWYKLTEQTRYAIYITIFGLIITVIIDIIFMPRFGYHAAAWSRLISYVFMILLSYQLGRKYFPIPYNTGRILVYFIIALGLFGISEVWYSWGLIVRIALNTLLMLIYMALVIRIEKINVTNLVKYMSTSILRK